MALRKRGKAGFYHCYFQARTADGTPARREVNLYTADLATARALEKEIMERNRAATARTRVKAWLESFAEAPTTEAAPAPTPPRRHRLKLSDWREAVEKYRPVTVDTVRIFNRFVAGCGVKYFDEVTPELALTYLQKHYGDPDRGKSFNNNKTALNSVFRFILVDAGMSASPFAGIPNRRHTADHQRPFSEKEFLALYAAAPEPLNWSFLIAWHTGLREETVFKLRWADIQGDVITILPGKTARFGRAVQIPLHPQLQELFAELPHTNEYVLGVGRVAAHLRRRFKKLLQDLNIRPGAGEVVNFNCFRNSFITRCDAAGIPRHAIRGVVGQVSDDITDLYSHDLTTARRIQSLPPVAVLLTKSKKK